MSKTIDKSLIIIVCISGKVGKNTVEKLVFKMTETWVMTRIFLQKAASLLRQFSFLYSTIFTPNSFAILDYKWHEFLWSKWGLWSNGKEIAWRHPQWLFILLKLHVSFYLYYAPHLFRNVFYSMEDKFMNESLQRWLSVSDVKWGTGRMLNVNLHVGSNSIYRLNNFLEEDDLPQRRRKFEVLCKTSSDDGTC